MNQDHIRNFCIIAHIDHGKSTLADRFLEITNTVEKRLLKSQTLDSMELEREKGITIKLKPVRMEYDYSGKKYQLNLIDTPGHVDFSYEVSRSLAACEGAILVVDATQGIQAQTVSNVYKAMDANLVIIPVINKIDISTNSAKEVSDDLVKTFGFKKEDILRVSAKTGQGVEELLHALIEKIPPPSGDPNGPTRGLIFDTFYDEFLGVVAAVRVIDGSFSSKETTNINLLATKNITSFQELGIFIPKRKKIEKLDIGEVGYIATGLKDINAVRVGDTVCLNDTKVEPLPGYKEVKPFVFVSIYPIDNEKFPNLRDALEKLSLSDSSLSFEPENNSALGFGFRCGFLGLLHADIVQERLEREYNLKLISTTPTVAYEVLMTDGSKKLVKRPADLPIPTKISEIGEPWILLDIVVPSEYVGGIITLCEERRGILQKMEYPAETRAVFRYELPLSELVHNFYDDLKSISSGFASMDYEFLCFRKVDAVKLDILVHGTLVEPFSQIVVRKEAQEIGRGLLLKLKKILPRQQFKVSLQAAIGGKIIAREDISAAGKNVLAGIYGGHRERKDKLLERQKKGKARLKKIGQVEIPQEAFRQILKT